MDFLQNTLLSGNSFKDFFPNKEFFTIVDEEVDIGPYEKEMKYINNFVTGGMDFYDNTNYINGLKHLKTVKYVIILQIPDDANVFVESDQYTSDKLIVIDKKPIEQMDIWDKPEIYIKIVNENPIFMKYIKNNKENVTMEMLKKNPSLINHVDKPTDDMIIASLSTSPYLLSHIKNPDMKLCIEAIKISPKCIQYIDNLTEEMCIELISVNKDVFEYIDNPTRSMCTLALMLDGKLIKHIKNHMIDKNLCELAFNNTKEAFLYIPTRYKSYEMCLDVVRYDGTYLEDVPDEHFVDEIMMEAVKHTPGAIQNIKGPSTKLCVEAIKRDPAVIKILDPLSIKKYFRVNNDYSDPKILDTIYKMLETDPEIFGYIPNPSYNICLKAVELDGFNIEYVSTIFQTEELCLKAIKANPWCIKYIKDQTDIYVLAAISENPKTIKYITETTPDIEMLAVKINGKAIKNIQNQTEELCSEAIKSDPKALKYIKNQTDKMCMEVIKLNPLYIKYVKQQTYELCALAVDLDPNAIEHIENPPFEICFAAISKDYKTMKHVKKQTLAFCQFAIVIDTRVCDYINNSITKSDCKKLIDDIKSFT
ncbi:protein of unknown function DUF4116 [Klosneuvirus KNV1]|uniref:DUF4116 domain-containing protein n=1 Tax=Klosneuvirus KNV1 TaxID=1977640 RepID=A0A1V0SL30_9VIRU|nr:protein of unknown function DUF4116 [Klosneuvirus KNV1]